MSKKVKISLLVFLILLISFTSFKITQAYLTYQRHVKNTFKVGYNTIEVEEDYTPPDKIENGKQFKKAIKVENTGNIPCYIRVRMEYSDSDMQKYCNNILDGKLTQAVDYPNQIVSLTNGDWIYSEDDSCYYYTKVVDPKDSTSNLLESVIINYPQDIESTEINIKDFDIYVYAESIQTMINKELNGELVAVEAKNYKEAWDQMLNKNGGV